jgi:hypothetical protein
MQQYERTGRDGWVRWAIQADGSEHAVHAAGKGDTSPTHLTYPRGYDHRCGWCWLNASHTRNEHERRVAALR